MRIPRLFTDQPLAPETTVRVGVRTGHYLGRVLRLRAGDRVVLFNGDGSDYPGSIARAARDAMEVHIDSRLPAAAESPLLITLVQAIGRGERMDLALQKATELGAAAFVPVFTERVEVRLDERRAEKRMMHWRGVIRSACEQCGRAVVPELQEPVRLEEWLAYGSGALRFMLDARAAQSLAGQTIGQRPVEVLVGPEGGLTEREQRLAETAGVRPVSLGPRVLRTETAGPAAVAVLQALAGDFDGAHRFGESRGDAVGEGRGPQGT